MRLSRQLLALAMAIGLAACASAASMVQIGPNPMSGLSAFPSVHALKAYDGRLYFGYGDWNYHPAVMIGSYRPETGRFHVEFSAYTDAIGVFREINGKLYVPHIDPAHYEDFKDYSVLANGVWRDAAPLGMLHVFDMATLTGTDIWCVGSRTDYDSTNGGGAAVYRSLDDGRTWQDLTVPTNEDRYYYCYIRGGKLYVRDTIYDEHGVGVRVSASSSATLAKTLTIRVGTNETVLALDTPRGPAVELDGPPSGGIYDFAWDGAYIYWLKPDGIYRREFPYDPGETMQKMVIEGIPNNPRSMEIMDGVIYVADSQGYLWGARVDGAPFTPPFALAVNEMADEFGRGLAVDGNTVAVGAPGHFGQFRFLSGQVTMWEYSSDESGASAWTKSATINPPAPVLSGWFGKDVCLKGDLMSVTESGRDTSSTQRGYSAQVHLYQNTSSGWVKRRSMDFPFVHSVGLDGESMVVAGQEILSVLPPPFGTSRALKVVHFTLARDSNDLAFVSATNRVWLSGSLGPIYEPVLRSAIESNTIVFSASGDLSRFGGIGQAYAYEYQPNGRWTFTNSFEHRETLPSGTNVLKPDRFGFSMALKNGHLAIGAPGDDDGASGAGAVYVYQKRALTNGGTSFVEVQRLQPPEPQAHGAFGSSLAMTETRLIVGSPGMEVDGVRHRGRVYVYERLETNWVLVGQMRRPESWTAEFGIEVAANENWMVAGSRFSEASSNLTDRVAIQRHLDPYSMWTAHHGLDGVQSEPFADSDGDGADNLAEFGYNMNPRRDDAKTVAMQGGTSGLPSVRWVQEEAGTFFEIVQLRRRNHTVMGLSYEVERSTALESWDSAEEQSRAVESVNEEWERVTLRFSVAIGEQQQFYRMKVRLSDTTTTRTFRQRL